MSSIRYKFRSVLNFESIEVGDRASISVRELRTKILRGKFSQPQQQGFDLVFFDAVSGLEYKGDDFQIPSGSSVIVKRVPCGTVPSARSPIEAVNNVKDSYTLNPAKEPIDEFDDFGADLYPILNANLPQSVQDINKTYVMNNGMEDFTGLRLECQNLDNSNLNQAIHRGSNQNGNERNIWLEARVEEQRKRSNNLPLELKCSLCKYYLKDAVMVRCCQHSFCENCISWVLIEKGSCPKCFSGQCSVGDLIPNLSLQQTIRRFLEYQVFDTGLENQNVQKYVPDGESGIGAEDISCALTVVKRQLEIPQSSCATGKGSNQVFESCYEQQPQRNVPSTDSGNHDSLVGDKDIKYAFSLHKVKEVDGVRGRYLHHDNMRREFEDVARSVTFQTESQLVIPQVKYYDEADSSAEREEELLIDSEGADINFLAHGGHSKGIRTCFTCGSPDHLMRDCPAFNLTLMFQSGNEAIYGGRPSYGPPYGNNSTFRPFRPYVNMYSNRGLMPSNASMAPVAPHTIHPYTSSIRGGFSVPSGNLRMGNMGPPRHFEFFGLQHHENRQKHSKENPREQFSDKYHDPVDRCADDKYGRRKNHYTGRQKRPYHSRRQKSSSKDVTRSSDQASEGRHEHHYGKSKYNERMGRCEPSDHSSRKGYNGRVESDIRVSHKRHHSYSESAYRLNSAVHWGRGYKERDIGHDSRHYRHSPKHLKR